MVGHLSSRSRCLFHPGGPPLACHYRGPASGGPTAEDAQRLPPSALPGRGFYKVQIGVRYLLIQMQATPNGPQPRVTVNLLINQMAHQPESTPAPQTVVLDLDGLFGPQAGKQMDVVDISDDDDDDEEEEEEAVVPVQQQQHKPLADFKLPVDLQNQVEWGSFIGSLAHSTTEEINAILPPRPQKKTAKKKKVSPPETAQ